MDEDRDDDAGGGREIQGTPAAETLSGTPGADSIEGDGGDDTLTGNAGADLFEFEPGDGDDVITDFGAGTDVLRFDNQPASAIDVTSGDAGARITHDGGSVVLEGVDAGDVPDAAIRADDDQDRDDDRDRDDDQDRDDDRDRDDDAGFDDSDDTQDSGPGSPNDGGSPAPPTPGDLNVLALTGEPQTLPLGFDADVRGTSAAETIQLTSDATVAFGAGEGDAVELSGSLADYDVSAGGNNLILSSNTQRAEISVNADTSVAFADGGATAGVSLVNGSAAVTLGGETVDAGFDAAAVNLDPARASDLDSADTGGGDTGGGLPARPADGGPAPVASGTTASENVDGNQGAATLSGVDGDDRFIFNQESTAVTIDDFATGDQLLFTDGLTEGDVAVSNTAFDDGEVTLEAGTVSVSLTNLSAVDEQIFDTGSFASEFGGDALGFA